MNVLWVLCIYIYFVLFSWFGFDIETKGYIEIVFYFQINPGFTQRLGCLWQRRHLLPGYSMHLWSFDYSPIASDLLRINILWVSFLFLLFYLPGPLWDLVQSLCHRHLSSSWTFQSCRLLDVCTSRSVAWVFWGVLQRTDFLLMVLSKWPFVVHSNVAISFSWMDSML